MKTARPSNAVVLLVLFLDLVGFSIIFPMLPQMLDWYGHEDGGLLPAISDWLASTFGIALDAGRRHAALIGGVLAGLYSIIQFVVTPFWGRLSDRIGRRPVLLATTTMNLLGYVLWMFSGSFMVFFVSRILCGFASGNIGVASAAVADLSTKENRAKAMGLMGAAIGLGFITGPAIGALCGLSIASAPVAATGVFAINPFTLPAGVAAALSLLNVVWLVRRFGETLPPEKRGDHGTTRSINPLRLFRRDLGPGLPRLNFAYLLFMVGFAGFEGTLVFLLVEHLDYDIGWSGLCMVWLGFCSAFVQGGLVRRAVKRTGERALALRGLVILIPGYALCAGVGLAELGPWALWVGVTLLAVGVGYLSPTMSAMVSLRTSAATQGAAMGSYRSVGALGRAIGPFGAAFLYFGMGAHAPYVAAAVLGVVPLVLLAGLGASAENPD